NLVVQDLELVAQDRDLHGIEPRGEAEADIIVLVAAMTVHADAAKLFRERCIIGEDRAAVAETSERLGREKARCRRKPESAEPPALVRGAKRLRGVVEHEQAFRFGYRQDAVEIR